MVIRHPKYTIFAIVCAAIVLFIIGFVIGFFSAPDSRKLPSLAEQRKAEAQEKLEYHKRFFDSLDAKKIGENLKYFSKHPHVGGTKRSKDLADEIAKRWKEYGFDKVEMPKYNVYLPYVDPAVSNSVKIVNENGSLVEEFTGKEKILDPSEDDPDMIAPLLGYAKPGTATGTLLYANYGRRKDFETLRTTYNITNCKGRIVIMRYGFTSRGNMVKNAQDCGAEGVILYSDPENFATEGMDKVYPNYIFLPSTGVQSGSILYDTYGDPLTPTVPSIDGVSRILPEEAEIPKKPAIPLSYGNAMKLLKRMKGHTLSNWWSGGLPITYRLGDEGMIDNVTINITVKVPNKRQDIYNVIGTIYGKEEPDRWVLIGNHRDAWGFGAVDACSGTASMMEMSRAMKDLLASGWRPRRTIKFCSWGAEEAGLMGSTEWVEENERYLISKGVAYINVDISVAGNETLRMGGSPLMKTTVFKNLKEVDDPHKNDSTKMTVYERMAETNWYGENEPHFEKLLAASDYTAFYQLIGVPCVDMHYTGEMFYPVYHTLYDTYNWLQLVDPTFVFHLTTTRVASRLLMEFADSLVLPFKADTFAKTLTDSFDRLTDYHGVILEANNVSLTYLEKAVMEFEKQSRLYTEEQNKNHESNNELAIRDLNDRIVNVEKSFIYSGGLPNRPTVRHLLLGQSLSFYGTVNFPGISDLLSPENKTEPLDWREIRKQVSLAYIAVLQATNALKPDKAD